ncbi:MAG: hypothetical protein O3B84_06595, partial [Chloroflexi bacterium]|nr:hypothetical protein [Chloroflexota bacterium]
VNNVMGGQNVRELGIGRNQKLLEKSLILTPDYLRSTLGLTARAFTDFKTPQGALARRMFAVMFGTAVGGTIALTEMLGGEFAVPNISDPTSRAWLNPKVRVGDRTINLNPFSRYLSVLRPAARGIAASIQTGDPGFAGMLALESVGQFVKGRQSAPLGAAVEALSGKDFFGNPIQQEPGEAVWQAQGKHLIRNLLPIGFQNIAEEGIGPALLPEFLGISTHTTSPAQNVVMQTLAAHALNLGVPASEVRRAVMRGVNPIYARDGDGRFILTAEQRSDMIEAAIETTGRDPETVRRMGREERTLSPAQKRAADDAVKEAFFRQGDLIQEEYATKLQRVTEWLQQTGDFVQTREAINDLRAARRAQQELRNDARGVFGPVIEALNDPERVERENLQDALRRQFLDAIFDTRFDDPFRGFDFEGQEQEIARWRNRIGNAQVEAFLSNPDLTPLERDLQDGRNALRPYWETADSIWRALGGTKYGPSQEENTAPPLFLRMFNRRLDRERRRLRMASPPIEAALVKWYGYQPIR